MQQICGTIRKIVSEGHTMTCVMTQEKNPAKSFVTAPGYRVPGHGRQATKQEPTRKSCGKARNNSVNPKFFRRHSFNFEIANQPDEGCSEEFSGCVQDPTLEQNMSVTMREMLEAGVHFGHQTRFWNPKMAPYIFGHRNKIHIVNLEQTMTMYLEAMNYIRQLAANRGTILMVGTKRQAREIIATEARRAGMPFVDQRWLGGMLTNYKTIRASVKRLKDMEVSIADGTVEKMSKKEGLMYMREVAKLDKAIGGIKDMSGLPDALFVVDVGYHKGAVAEAIKLGIPVIGIVDTNHSPDGITYVIPGNDDSSRAIQLYARGVADAILEGKANSMHEILRAAKGEEEEPEIVPVEFDDSDLDDDSD